MSRDKKLIENWSDISPPSSRHWELKEKDSEKRLKKSIFFLWILICISSTKLLQIFVIPKVIQADSL